MPDLRKLHELIKPSSTGDGDGQFPIFTQLLLMNYSNDIKAISALVLAIHMINNYCKKLKYKRKIVLITDGEGAMNGDGIDQITQKLKQDDIELVVLWVLVSHLNC